MAHDAELPSTLWSAARGALANLLWILPLISAEAFLLHGDTTIGVIAGLAWLVAIFVAVKLDLLHGLLSDQTRRRELLTWVLIIGGAAALGYGIARLSSESPTTTIVHEPATPEQVAEAARRLPPPTPIVIHDPPTAEQIAASAQPQVRAAQGQVAAAVRERDELKQRIEALQNASQQLALPSGPEYLKDARFSSYGADGLPTLQGEAAKSFDILRIAVDYKNGPEQKRVLIGTLNQVINATTLQIPLVSKTASGNIFQWGDSNNGDPFPDQPFSIPSGGAIGYARILARVAIIGPDNGEQYKYFDAIRLKIRGAQDQLIIIGTSADLARFWPTQK